MRKEGNNMLRVCVIGLGHIGNLHSRIYLEDELVELVGVCDINEERAVAELRAVGGVCAKAAVGAAA